MGFIDFIIFFDICIIIQNCLFRAIAYCIYRNEERYKEIKNKVQEFIEENWEEASELLGLNQEIKEDHLSYVNDYLQNVGVDGVWGTENDIIILRSALKRDVFVISDDDTHLEELNSSVLEPDKQPIFISHEGGNHFNSIYRKSESDNINENDFIKRTKRKRQQSIKLIQWRQVESTMKKFDTPPTVKKRRRSEDNEWVEN
jgi:hypothetical protein